MIRDAHSYAPAARMLQPLRHLPGGVQYEGVAPGRRGLEQPELPVVHARVLAHFREIAADQREMVALIDLADGAYALHCGLVAQMAAERIAGIGRIHDDSA